MAKFKFTRISVTAPDLAIGTHYDTEVKNLVLNVTAHSRKFGIYGWYNGSATRKSIGDVADWSITAVREEALKVIQQLKAAPKVKTSPTTLAGLAEAYTKELIKQGKRDTTYILNAMRLSWQDIEHRKIDTITKEELNEAHFDIGENRGRSAANSAITVLRMLFNYAIDEELIARNPASRVKLYPEASRDVFLNEGELLILREAIKTLSVDIQDYIKIILGTGFRKTNAAGIRWEWIVKNNDDWTIIIPAEFSKNKSDIVMPCTDEVVSILKRREGNGSEFVFPGKAEGKPIQEVWNWLLQVRKVAKAAGIRSDFSLHDLRRSAASLLGSKGASVATVAKFLSHKSLHTVSTYMRADVGDVRAALARM
jgi:integrase